MLNIIFFITMYPVLFLIYFIYKIQFKPNDNYLFAVSIKKEWLEEKAVQDIINSFKKQMNVSLLILMVLPFSSLLSEHVSIQFSIWMLWLLLMIFMLFIPFPIANHKLKEWKKEQHIYQEEQLERYTEMKNAGSVRRVTFLPFFLPTLFSFVAAIVPAIFDKVFDCSSGLIISLIILAACTALLWLMAYWMDRQPVEVISFDSDINVNFTRAKKNIWKNFWLACCWINTIFVASISFSSALDYPTGAIILVNTVIYCLLIFGICIPLIKKFRSLQIQYNDKRDFTAMENEDNYWIGGFLYYNPKDHRTLIEKRVGIGTTVNVATPLGKGLTIISVLALLMIPISCVFMIMEEFTPIELRIENDTLYAQHIRIDYEIPIEDIENVSMIDELPSWSKSSGTAMDNLEKGKFHIRNHGKCEVFLNPQNDAFICFTANGEEYYVSGFDDAQTEYIYEQITNE